MFRKIFTGGFLYNSRKRLAGALKKTEPQISQQPFLRLTRCDGSPDDSDAAWLGFLNWFPSGTQEALTEQPQSPDPHTPLNTLHSVNGTAEIC